MMDTINLDEVGADAGGKTLPHQSAPRSIQTMKNTLTLVHSRGGSANPAKRMLRLISSHVEGAKLPFERVVHEPTHVIRHEGCDPENMRPHIVERNAVESYKQMIAIVGAGDAKN